ncbi:MAG: polyprenyl synthetase family protein [Oligoflexales bacterium]|nr:polyprenyl synthetase family protein [Oligoflexales bacterium]
MDLSPWKYQLDLFETYFQLSLDLLYPEASQLHQACRYALEGKGKRIRPLLALLCSQNAGEQASPSSELPAAINIAVPAALALEYIHTYSLVHDDLPSLDNDDLRRGRATVHKVYGEAMAILVGDALLSDAFLLLHSKHLTLEKIPNPTALSWQTSFLAKAIGSQGMVAGQALDILSSNNKDQKNSKLELLEYIHRQKTGRLLAASAALGAAAGLAANKNQHDFSVEDTSTLKIYADFGFELGLAFQMLDDLLDEKANTGKSLGKDKSSGKFTYRTFYTEAELAYQTQIQSEKTIQILQKMPGGDKVGLEMLSRELLNRSF